MAGIEYALDGDLASITVNRPERRNALTSQDWVDLGRAANTAVADRARAVLLRGAGSSFSAGFDISEITPGEVDALELVDGIVNPALLAIRQIPVPTVAAVEGACVGGGLGIAAACDVILASETAKFAVPYTQIGIMADAGAHLFLREAIGYQRAADLIFSGRMLSAQDALTLGLCAQVSDAAAFEQEVDAYVGALAKGPTQALVRSKSILRSVQSVEEGLAVEARLQAEVFETQDAYEGITAFLQGRKPVFKGE
ncbi:putative enoyl-CoA hydratase (plasmid) [Sulfitobacter sp. THAF37]|uniref:enoyl-CoA hydratase/isomerase family protein n=1 Tax=Sulfitobacter sp. THAF37 TaxID=2587855 RepID=UPI0012A88215|nr:enoyl-CoA hydratase-related protein [Sulfitobacter sp. THAF37]QFT61054.1 putative enoyl-CoA hydratase [Sulfitobacter sp. THAF37]